MGALKQSEPERLGTEKSRGMCFEFDSRPMFRRRFTMDQRQPEKPTVPQSTGQSLPPSPETPKRRFQIVKLEERIAPGKGGTNCHKCFGTGATTRF
jgi:hypothetical protein